MRVVAIVGSMRRGNTYAMVESACHAIGTDCEVELVHIKDMTISFCDGCLTCDEAGKCHINDSMTPIIKSIVAADALIIGTPARWSLLSGELKVLIDRLNPLATQQKLKGKTAIVFAVGQSTPEQDDSVKCACDSVTAFCDNAGIEVLAKVLAFGCLNATDLIEKSPDVLDKCKRAARKLVGTVSR
jgi:multimeric flavodoxin WrbA